MRKISTKYIMYKMCAHHAQHLCTSTMYINIMQCAKIYHPWNLSIICLYQHVNMCIYQYANHVYPPICQPCESTNMPTMCIYQHAKQCISIISLMICLHHERSATIRYLKQMSIVVLIKYYQWCSIIKHIPSMSVPNMYINISASIHTHGLVSCSQDIILHNPIDEHLNLQQIVSEPAKNNVRPCNIVLYHHIKLQSMCISFFSRLYHLYVVCCTTTRICT
jgi:hypothetical protein